MNLKLSSKQIICFLLICLFITSVAGILVTVMIKPYVLYIRLRDVTWPPYPYYQGENILGVTYVNYSVYTSFEIWNPTKKTLVYNTSHSNLVDPQMEIKLEEDYPISSGYAYWSNFTTHELKPGITKSSGRIGFEVVNYNATIPPAGIYTIWAGIVEENLILGEPPSPVKPYKTVIDHNSNDSEIKSEHTPNNWGLVAPCYRKLSPPLLWTLTGGELIAIMYFYRTNRELLVKVYFHKTNQRKKKNN